MTDSKKTLDEKCWKGYKKKGMKTMFGKRYPNCVKVKKEGFSDWRSELEKIEEKTKLKNTNYGPAVVYQDNEKTIPARVKKMMTGGDGTAYMGEKMDLKKADMGDVITDFRKSDAPQFKGKSDKKIQKMAIAAKLEADEVKEALDKDDKPFVKDLVKKLRSGSKTHAKQADNLEKAMKENTAIESELTIQDWNVDDIKFTEIETVDIIKAKPLKENMSNWRDELDEDWQKVNRKDKTDGMSKAAVKAYRSENPGSKLKTAVTKDPKKLKKGSKSAKRRLAFCRRMKGMKKKLTSAKTRRDPDSRINKALRRWNC